MSARGAVATLATVALFGCARSVPTDPPAQAAPAPLATVASDASGAEAGAASSTAPLPVVSAPAASARSPRSPRSPRPLSARTDGAHELPLTPDRPILYARPIESPESAAGPRPWRLVGHLHGICHPPSYSAGRWLGAAVDVGVLVSPSGNARCGDANLGPPSWEAPSWEELVATMDADLERSIAKVEAKHPGSVRRSGAVLTGFSRGAFAAPVIARMHPGRWPLLVLIEANAPVTAASLRKAGVRAVAWLAGEVGTELAGERKTDAELRNAGFPSTLIVMPRVAHLYPDDMDDLMREALEFVLSHEHDGGDAAAAAH
jgi:hypothetical protein